MVCLLAPGCTEIDGPPAGGHTVALNQSSRMAEFMRPSPTLLLAALVLAAAAVPRGAVAQQLGNPFDDGTPPSGKRPYAGPQYSGKPPPLGASGAAAGTAPAQPGADGMPPAGARPSSSGTGFIVAPGRLITNNHVVADCVSMVARNAQGSRVAARVLNTDRRRDLALLSVPNDIGPPLPFRDTPPVRRGETVITFGFPLSGLLSSGPTLTSGDISALSGLRDNPMNFQISAPVQPGNSGGPLLDTHGNVLGIVVSKLNAARIAEMTGGDIPQNVNFAVKGTEAVAFLKSNNVALSTGSSSGPDKQASDVGDIANPSTVYLQCYK